VKVFYEEVPSAALLPPGLNLWEAEVGYLEDFLDHREPQVPIKLMSAFCRYLETEQKE